MRYLLIIVSFIVCAGLHYAFVVLEPVESYRTFTVEEMEHYPSGFQTLEVSGFASNRYENDAEVLAKLTMHIMLLYGDRDTVHAMVDQIYDMKESVDSNLFDNRGKELEIRKL